MMNHLDFYVHNKSLHMTSLRNSIASTQNRHEAVSEEHTVNSQNLLSQKVSIEQETDIMDKFQNILDQAKGEGYPEFSQDIIHDEDELIVRDTVSQGRNSQVENSAQNFTFKQSKKTGFFRNPIVQEEEYEDGYETQQKFFKDNIADDVDNIDTKRKESRPESEERYQGQNDHLDGIKNHLNYEDVEEDSNYNEEVREELESDSDGVFIEQEMTGRYEEDNHIEESQDDENIEPQPQHQSIKKEVHPNQMQEAGSYSAFFSSKSFSKKTNFSAKEANQLRQIFNSTKKLQDPFKKQKKSNRRNRRNKNNKDEDNNNPGKGLKGSFVNTKSLQYLKNKRGDIPVEDILIIKGEESKIKRQLVLDELSSPHIPKINENTHHLQRKGSVFDRLYNQGVQKEQQRREKQDLMSRRKPRVASDPDNNKPWGHSIESSISRPSKRNKSIRRAKGEVDHEDGFPLQYDPLQGRSYFDQLKPEQNEEYNTGSYKKAQQNLSRKKRVTNPTQRSELFFQRNLGWLNKKEQLIANQRYIKHESEMDGCTFQPEIHENYQEDIPSGLFETKDTLLKDSDYKIVFGGQTFDLRPSPALHNLLSKTSRMNETESFFKNEIEKLDKFNDYLHN